MMQMIKLFASDGHFVRITWKYYNNRIYIRTGLTESPLASGRLTSCARCSYDYSQQVLQVSCMTRGSLLAVWAYFIVMGSGTSLQPTPLRPGLSVCFAQRGVLSLQAHLHVVWVACSKQLIYDCLQLLGFALHMSDTVIGANGIACHSTHVTKP